MPRLASVALFQVVVDDNGSPLTYPDGTRRAGVPELTIPRISPLKEDASVAAPVPKMPLFGGVWIAW